MLKTLRQIGTLLITAALFSACAATKRLSAPLPQTFLEGVNLSEKKERLPFDHAWSAPNAAWDSYKTVFIKPIRTDLLPDNAWKDSISFAITDREDYLAKVHELAKYFQEQLIAEIGKRNGKHLANLASAAGPGVAVVEIAFTEVEFSHPLKNAGALAAPLPGAGVISSAISDPYVTFALRVTDGATHTLLATAADRKFAPVAVLNVNKLTISSANREICGIWAEEIADTLGSDRLTKVDGTTWKLLPW